MCKVVLQSPILNCIILGMLAGGSGNILGDSSRSCGTGCSGLGEAVGTGSEVVCGWNQRWRSVAWPTLAERVQGFSPSTLFSRSLKQAPTLTEEMQCLRSTLCRRERRRCLQAMWSRLRRKHFRARPIPRRKCEALTT